jgi:hypothetical protein
MTLYSRRPQYLDSDIFKAIGKLYYLMAFLKEKQYVFFEVETNFEVSLN